MHVPWLHLQLTLERYLLRLNALDELQGHLRTSMHGWHTTRFDVTGNSVGRNRQWLAHRSFDLHSPNKVASRPWPVSQ